MFVCRDLGGVGADSQGDDYQFAYTLPSQVGFHVRFYSTVL
jgi:hypothetical protein